MQFKNTGAKYFKNTGVKYLMTMQQDMLSIMQYPSPAKVLKYCQAHKPENWKNKSLQQIMACVYWARLLLKIDVIESTKWLVDRGLEADPGKIKAGCQT